MPATGHSYDLPHMYMTSNAQTRSTNDYCQTWNRENYRTFDNKLYKFMSRCTYILAKDCIHQTFSIYTTNKQDCIDGQRCTTDIDIYIGMDHALSLSRNNHTTTVSHSRLSHLDYRYIFSQSYSLQCFLIFAHLWCFGVGVLDWVIGVGVFI